LKQDHIENFVYCLVMYLKSVKKMLEKPKWESRIVNSETRVTLVRERRNQAKHTLTQ